MPRAAPFAPAAETIARLEGLALQFGGAAGTLARSATRASSSQSSLPRNCQLPLPDAPWHTHRDRIAEVASVLAILSGTCGKIARDVSLMMQTDVGEAFEPSGEGRGGSSTMPHKRNPVAAATASWRPRPWRRISLQPIFAAQIQDHERSAGPWHAEWPTLPTLLLVTSGALAAIVDIAEGLEVDAERMRANLDTTTASSWPKPYLGARRKARQERRPSSGRGRHQARRRRDQKASARCAHGPIPSVSVHTQRCRDSPSCSSRWTIRASSQALIDRQLASLQLRRNSGDTPCP